VVPQNTRRFLSTSRKFWTKVLMSIVSTRGHSQFIHERDKTFPEIKACLRGDLQSREITRLRSSHLRFGPVLRKIVRYEIVQNAIPLVSVHFWFSSKLPRSYSATSPSSPKNSAGRSDVSKRGWRSTRRRRSSFTADAITGPSFEWSTSYQAGSSRSVALGSQSSMNSSFVISSAFGSSTDNDSDDTDVPVVRQRGRDISPTIVRVGASGALGRHERAISPQNHSSGSQGSRGKRRATQPRSTFTRSRSPASNHALPSRVLSPFARSRPISNFRYVLPTALRIETNFPCTNIIWTFAIDAKKLAEYLMLVGSLLYAAAKLLDRSAEEPIRDLWLSLGLFCPKTLHLLLTLHSNRNIYCHHRIVFLPHLVTFRP
jgi:hypothetical protein